MVTEEREVRLVECKGFDSGGRSLRAGRKVSRFGGAFRS